MHIIMETKTLKQITYLSLCGGLILFVLFSASLATSIGNMKRVTIAEAQTRAKLNWKIDQIKMGSSSDITGWAFYPGESIKVYGTHVLLKDSESEQFYQIPTKMVIRADLNKQYPSSHDYSSGGFFARVKMSQLKAPPSHYKLYLSYTTNDRRTIVVKTNLRLPNAGSEK
ncbi:hypothetical protein, partial [Sporolactobacillus inulinus]